MVARGSSTTVSKQTKRDATRARLGLPKAQKKGRLTGAQKKQLKKAALASLAYGRSLYNG